MARLGSASLASLFPLLLVACSDGSVVSAGVGNGSGGATQIGPGNGGNGAGGGSAVPGLAVGEACTASADCRSGLVCTSGKCAFGHANKAGATCIAAGDCNDGLQCAPGVNAATGKPADVCTAPNADAGAEGAGCTSDTGCQAGLRCGIVGFAAQCVPQGTADVGQPCALSADCYGGLICTPSVTRTADGGTTQGPSSCAPISAAAIATGKSSPFGIPIPPPLVCEQPSQSGVDVKAYFDVPGAKDTATGDDFFRLPFPNDVRITKGKIDLTGFPTPGSSLLGFDPVQIYLDAIVANEKGWGAYPTALFRFSGPIDFSTFTAGTGVSPVQYMDITDPANPGNGGAVWTYSGEGGKYICHDWFAVRHPEGSPLIPGHIYTVYLTTQGRGANGRVIDRAPELVALLDKAAPSDPALANGYAAFKPLRDYLSVQGIDPNTVLNGTVFTVGPTRAPMDALALAAKTAPVPAASDWVKCGAGAVSPCPQATDTRACGSGTADYDEYHALISLPIFQKGVAPYLTAGGDIDSTAPVRTEKVCAALTVPKKTMPVAGFPIAVFAHGTGGSFRDHVRDEVAGALARSTPPMAVLGYDQVEHGPRRGTSTDSPNNLFFNFKNPAAARGNPLQGAADVISVGRLAAALTVPATVTGGAALKTDPAGVVFFGHSQGSMHGSLGLPYTNDYTAAVLSGNGASLMHALLSKTAPQNIAQAVPFALGGDFDAKLHLFGGDSHPVLTILQQWIDPADPLNFAKAIGREPDVGINPKSVFQTYGRGDTYSPPVTLRTYAIAANLALAAHDASVTTADPIADFVEQPVPLSGTFAKAGHTVTLAVREYENTKGDGHFVVFDVPSATQDAARFLSMAASGKIPQVGQ
jgi:hypothetical protein